MKIIISLSLLKHLVYNNNNFIRHIIMRIYDTKTRFYSPNFASVVSFETLSYWKQKMIYSY